MLILTLTTDGDTAVTTHATRAELAEHVRDAYIGDDGPDMTDDEILARLEDWEEIEFTITPAKRYTVLCHDGIGPGNPFPEEPSADNQAATLEDARALFQRWMRDSGNDYTRAEGYGQPFADIVWTASWDGTSYGDVTGGDGIERLERGPRGGIVRNSF